MTQGVDKSQLVSMRVASRKKKVKKGNTQTNKRKYSSPWYSNTTLQYCVCLSLEKNLNLVSKSMNEKEKEGKESLQYGTKFLSLLCFTTSKWLEKKKIDSSNSVQTGS